MAIDEQFTVLFLDDEANILRAMKRLFHGRKYRLVLVDQGAKALEFLKSNKVHVVVSDMKMPTMTGETFLTSVAQLYPDTYRIVLSGFADTTSLLKVVNEGRIHRFLQKPWNNEALIEAIDEGVEKFKLQAENAELESKLQRQNQRLANLNTSLEERVELRTLQIKTAMKRSEQGVTATKKIIFNTLSTIPFIDTERAKKVSKLAEQIAGYLKLDAQTLANVSYAGLIHELGLITVSEKIYNTPYTQMTPAQQEAYNTQGNNALLVLSPSAQLKNVTDIVVSQFEHVNGSGYPKGLKEDDIVIGAQILAVARDFYRYTLGLVDDTQHNQQVALGKLNNYAGLAYSKTVLAVLNNMFEQNKKDTKKEGYTASEVKEGMQLTDAIYNDKDILIMPQGQILDAPSIQKLKDLEKRFDTTLTIFAE